ncbi:DUF4342 domain-containing protein [Clostridium sp. DJ247]|uniref:DUF4342 domain-containing protein n=1 Tax=Clostridium sp. DJ247 TaxID=2726188 RepID=UPI0016272430|nr:DUF4342 domain-containing protein [Clostridium sp. DJ247]MBC2578777.1 DUF4342 domain-containing protein [Clostridium sp. DJ247]
MKATLEQIDLLRQRANVSYKDAKEALEKCNNDIVEALIYLEKEKKTKENSEFSCSGSFIAKVKSLIKKGNKIKFIISKNENIILNLPINLIILITIIAPPLSIAALLIVLFTNHKIRIKNEKNENMEVNKVFDKMSMVVNNAKNTLTKDEDNSIKNDAAAQ